MSKCKLTSARSIAKAEAAWSAAQRLQQFGYCQISSEISCSMTMATHIVRTWLREGRVRVVHLGVSGAARKMFEVLPDHELRALPAIGDSTDQMWTAMRKLVAFTPTDIAAHCAVVVLVDEAQAYCRLLLAGGYMRVLQKAVPGRKEAIYRLFNVTGIMAPREKRVRCIIDDNLGTVRPMLGAGQ